MSNQKETIDAVVVDKKKTKEKVETEQKPQTSNENNKAPKKGKKSLWLVILLLIAGLAYGLYIKGYLPFVDVQIAKFMDKKDTVEVQAINTTAEVKTEAAKTEEVKTEAAKTEEVKTEAAKTEEVKTETAKTEEVKTEAAKTEAAKTEEAKIEAVKTEEAKTEEVKTEEAKTAESKTTEVKTESEKVAQASLSKEAASLESMVSSLVAGKINSLQQSSAKEATVQLRLDNLISEFKMLGSTLDYVSTAEEDSAKSIQSIEKKLKELTKSLKVLQTRYKTEAMLKAQPLIEDAVRFADIYHKPQQAAQLLQNAAVLLKADNSPEHLTTIHNLSIAASDLLAIKKIDVVGINKSIDSLSSLVGSLSFRGNEKPEVTEKTSVKEKAKSWEVLADTVWTDVRSLVRISKDHTNGLSRMVSPEAQSLAYQMTRLQLQKLQLAAASANQEQFDQTLNETGQLLKETFDLSTDDGVVFLSHLKKLSLVTVQEAKTPQSMTAVRKLLGR